MNSTKLATKAAISYVGLHFSSFYDFPQFSVMRKAYHGIMQGIFGISERCQIFWRKNYLAKIAIGPEVDLFFSTYQFPHR